LNWCNCRDLAFLALAGSAWRTSSDRAWREVRSFCGSGRPHSAPPADLLCAAFAPKPAECKPAAARPAALLSNKAAKSRPIVPSICGVALVLTPSAPHLTSMPLTAGLQLLPGQRTPTHCLYYLPGALQALRSAALSVPRMPDLGDHLRRGAAGRRNRRPAAAILKEIVMQIRAIGKPAVPDLIRRSGR